MNIKQFWQDYKKAFISLATTPIPDPIYYLELAWEKIMTSKRTAAMTFVAGAITLLVGVTAYGVAQGRFESSEPSQEQVSFTTDAPSPIISPSPTSTPKPPTIEQSDTREDPIRSLPKPNTQSQPAPRPGTPAQSTKTISFSPITALNDQSAIDRGNLVTWMTSPTCLLAGHDTSGWAWIDTIATGTIINVKTGPCVGQYKIVGHKWQSVKGGAIPSWMGSYDLVLQTCTGSTGMGFSLAQRIQ
jgi:hypothetical protein